MHFDNPRAAELAGISVVYQELSLVPNLSVAENIYNGWPPTNRLGLMNTGEMQRTTDKMLEGSRDPERYGELLRQARGWGTCLQCIVERAELDGAWPPSFAASMLELVSAIDEDREPMSNGEDYLQIQRVIEATPGVVVIDDKAMLAEIGDINPNAKMAQHAPMAILVCADLSLEKSVGYWVVDCAATVENILLAAHALGLGAVWTGVYPRQERMDGLKKLVGLPEGVMAHSLIVLGYPAEQPTPQDRYQSDRVRRNHW